MNVVTVKSSRAYNLRENYLQDKTMVSEPGITYEGYHRLLTIKANNSGMNFNALQCVVLADP